VGLSFPPAAVIALKRSSTKWKIRSDRPAAFTWAIGSCRPHRLAAARSRLVGPANGTGTSGGADAAGRLRLLADAVRSRTGLNTDAGTDADTDADDDADDAAGGSQRAG